MNTFIHIGFGNFVQASHIISIVRADSAPIKRLVSQAKDKQTSVDATQGRKTKSVIIASDGRVILSALLPETIANRLGQLEGSEKDD